MDHSRTGLSEREEKLLRALQRRKKREEEGRFVAEGVRVVEDLLASPLESEWLVAASSLEDTPRGQALLHAAEQRALPIRRVADDAFQKLAATDHAQGVLAVARVPHARWEMLEGGERTVLLLLDAVQDPGNLGTLVRTAEAMGVAAIVTLPGTVDPWNAKAVRSAVGSSFRVPLLSATWAEARQRLSAFGCTVLAAEVGGAPVVRADGPVALVVGNEGAGLSQEVRDGVDGTVGIPLKGRAESLNVAAAAAVLLYELTR